MIGWLLAPALAGPPLSDAEVIGLELLIIEPVAKRLFFLEKRPDVEHPAPIEGVIGHVMVRLVDDGPVAEQRVVGAYAYMDVDGDGIDDPTNAWKGLFGGYDLRLVVLPLPHVAEDYALGQDRWIRRYPLPTTEAELQAFLKGVDATWARSEAHTMGSYRFLTENCSTELTQLVNEALLGRDREFNYPFTLPRKYRRHGRVVPPTGTVQPEDTRSGDPEVTWRTAPELLRLCPEDDLDCAETWVAVAREELGGAWVREASEWMDRPSYRDVWAHAHRAALLRATHARD